VARAQEELAAHNRTQEQLRSDLHAAEKKNIELKGDREDEAHVLRTQIRELETKIVKVKADWDRDHTTLSESIASGRNQVEVLERALQSSATALTEKERDSTTRIHEAREQEWNKYRDLEREKMEIEGRLREMERQTNHAAAQELEKQRAAQTVLAQLQGELAEAKFGASTMEEELTEAKACVTDQKSQLDRLRHVEGDLEKAHAKRETVEKALTELQVGHADVRSKLAIKGNEFDQVQDEMEVQRKALKSEADGLRKSLATSMETAAAKEQQMTEDAKRLYDKLQAVCTAASSQKAKLKTERRELRVLVKSLEDRLATQADAKIQADKENQRCHRELRTLQRKVELFGSSMHTNGQASPMDMFAAAAGNGGAGPIPADPTTMEEVNTQG
jgi:chromosome segregation ATPase